MGQPAGSAAPATRPWIKRMKMNGCVFRGKTGLCQGLWKKEFRTVMTKQTVVLLYMDLCGTLLLLFVPFPVSSFHTDFK